MLTLPAFAGEKPVIAQPPVEPPVVNSCADSVWSWEVAGSYSWGANKPYDLAGDVRQKKVNTVGADITLVRQLPSVGWFKDHALFLRLGYNWGDRTWGLGEGLSTKFRAHSFTVMPGYRMTHKITDSLSYHIGGSLGITNRSDKAEFTDLEPIYPAWQQQGITADGVALPIGQTVRIDGGQMDGVRSVTRSSSKSAVGFAASLELGLRYAINPCWDVFCAYQVTVNTARTKFNIDGTTVKTKSQLYHGVRLGFGRKF